MQGLESIFGWCGVTWIPWVILPSPSNVAAQTAGSGAADGVSDVFIPLISQIGLGAAMGFCVGFMIKKVSKLAAIIVGLAFVLLQVLAYYDVMTIDWAPIKGWWDQATTPDQLQGWWAQVRSILFSNVPSLGGAIPGFVLGIKMG